MDLIIFKKLRFLDYLFIIIGFIVIIIYYQFLNPQYKQIEVTILDDNLPIFQAYAFNVGDLEVDPTGEKIAEIIEVKTYDIPNSPSSNKDLFVKARLKVVQNPRSKELEYKNRAIKIGSAVEMRFTDGYLTGIIKSLNNQEKADFINENKIITLRLYNQWPWLADNLVIGQGETDLSGNKTIELLTKQISPAQITSFDVNGNAVSTVDPNKIDLTLKIKMSVQKYNDEFIFNRDRKIVNGEMITIDIDHTTLKDASITNIE